MKSFSLHSSLGAPTGQLASPRVATSEVPPHISEKHEHEHDKKRSQEARPEAIEIDEQGGMLGPVSRYQPTNRSGDTTLPP